MKARLILWRDCKRTCSYCCNKNKQLLSSVKVIDTVTNLWDEYEEVILTGGEPMLHQDKLFDVIDTLNAFKHAHNKLYLYSALYTEWTESVIDQVDGMHFTLHENTDMEDYINFMELQQVLKEKREVYKDKSFRLYIHKNIQSEVCIVPKLWSKVDMKLWVKEDERVLPDGEELLQLDESYFRYL